MDDLLDKLIELIWSYNEAKAELKDCMDNCDFDADYVCRYRIQKCDEYKDNIKATIKKIVDISKGE